MSEGLDIFRVNRHGCFLSYNLGMTKLSVIIPVYNVKDYIRECLDSILAQSFDDFEIICVDDGSSDGSLDILNDYKKRDGRIVVINKMNEGSGVARNYGLSFAQGKYVYFVDADDVLAQDALKIAVSVADTKQTDILIFGAYSLHEGRKRNGGYSSVKFPRKYLGNVFSAKEIKREIFKFPSTAWTKLYKREFLLKNNIKFQEIRTGQDQLLFFHSMIKAERIYLLAKNLYYYRKNRKGAVTCCKKKQNYSPIYVFLAIEKLLKDEGLFNEYKHVFVSGYFSKATSWLGKFHEDMKAGYYKEYIKLLHHIREEYSDGWWQYFIPKRTDSYCKLKIKQLVAKNFCFMLQWGGMVKSFAK